MNLDPKATNLVRVLSYERQLLCCRYSPDSEQLYAAGFDGQLHRWTLDTKTEKPVDKHEAFPAHKGWVETMVQHPDGTRLFTADSWGSVRCWNIGSGNPVEVWSVEKAHSTWLRRITISPNGDRIATCGNDRAVRVFSSTNGKLVHELVGHEHPVQSACFHKDSNTVVSGDLFGKVKHWNLKQNKCVRELDASKLYKKYQQYDQGGVRCSTFDSDYKTLFCAGFEGVNANQAHGNPTVVAFDWASGKVQRVFTTKTKYLGPIVDVVYHPAGVSDRGGKQ